MIAYPDIAVTPGQAPLYRALVGAGETGLTGREILTSLYGEAGDRLPAKHAASRLGRLREQLRPHGMEVFATHKGGQPDGRFCLRRTPQRPVDDSKPVVVIDPRVIAGFRVYEHKVGPEFDTAGAMVTLRYVEGLRP